MTGVFNALRAGLDLWFDLTAQGEGRRDFSVKVQLGNVRHVPKPREKDWKGAKGISLCEQCALSFSALACEQCAHSNMIYQFPGGTLGWLS